MPIINEVYDYRTKGAALIRIVNAAPFETGKARHRQ